MMLPMHNNSFAAPGVYHGRPARGLWTILAKGHGTSPHHRQDAGGTLQTDTPQHGAAEPGVYHGRPARGHGTPLAKGQGTSPQHRQDAGGTLAMERIFRP